MSEPGVAPEVPSARAAARELALRLPAAPGVYRFSDARGRVLYLGRAVSLRRRAVSYWGDLGDRRHLAPMVARTARLEAVVCDSVHEAAWLERNLLQASLPPWNRAPSGGQEKEVWIRLSASARTPGVAVVHRRRLRPAPGTSARISAGCRCAGRCRGCRGCCRWPTPGARRPAPGTTWRAFLGHRRAEGHHGDAGRLRRLRLGRRRADPFHRLRRAAVRLDPARVRRCRRPPLG